MMLTKSTTPITLSLQPLHGNKPAHGIRFSKSLLASVGFDGTCHLWSALSLDDSFNNLAIVKCSKRPLLQVDFLIGGRRCLGACADGGIYIIDTDETLSSIGTLMGHDSYVNGVSTMNENCFASSSDDYTVKLWDVREPSFTTNFELPREATSVACSPQSPQQVFCGSLDNKIRCFDPRNPSEPMFVLLGHSDTVTGLSLSSDGRELLSCGIDGTIGIWDSSAFSAKDNRLIQQIPHGVSAGDSISDRSLLRCSWTPDDRYISAGSGSGSQFVVCMWTKKGIPFKAFPGHEGFVTEVAFHPTENIMASCGMDGKLLVGGYL